MSLTVLILQYNGTELTKRLLHTISEKDAEVFDKYDLKIIDNASTQEDGFEYFEQHFPSVTLLKNSENFGFANGLNPHLKEVNTSHVLLLNNDIELMNDAISSSFELLRSEGLDGITCYMKDGNGRVMNNFSGFLHPFSRLIFNATGITNLWIRWVKGRKKTSRVGYINGGFLILDMEAFRKVGFFCKHYFMYTEDVDLMIKLEKLGVKMGYSSVPKVLHFDGVSAASIWNNEEKYLLQLKQVLDCYKRNYSWFWFLVFKFVKLLGEAKKGQRKWDAYKLIMKY